MDREPAKETLSDEELMNRLAIGETWALGQVYLRYGDEVLQLLSRTLTGHFQADVDDACQNVFLRVYKLASRYVHTDQLRSWLFKIALRESKSISRKEWNRKRLFRQFVGEKEVTSLTSIEFESSAEDTKQKLSKAIGELTHGQREVLMLAMQEGMNGPVIAKTLGLKPNAVRAKLFRARQAIALSLGLDQEDTGD